MKKIMKNLSIAILLILLLFGMSTIMIVDIPKNNKINNNAMDKFFITFFLPYPYLH